MSTKATRAAKTVARYRSLLDTVVLPLGKDVPLREVQFDDLQVWSTSLSVEGSVRFASKGLSASRVRQAYQLVGAILKFAVKAKHLSANPADGVELPGCRKPSSVTLRTGSSTGWLLPLEANTAIGVAVGTARVHTRRSDPAFFLCSATSITARTEASLADTFMN
jgi:site-specific recombinase XerC